MQGKRIKKRLLEIVVMSICIAQLQFLAEVAAKEQNLIQLSGNYGSYYQQEIAGDAEEPQIPQEPIPEEDSEATLKEPEVVEETAPAQKDQEVVEERTATSRTYRMSDGSYLTEQFFEPIHKEEEGELVEIDDSIGEGIRLFNGEQQFRNADGLLNVVMNEQGVWIDNVEVRYPQADLSQPVSKQNAVLYNDTEPGQDMQITVRSDKVFQEIKYEEKPQEAVFVMELHTEYEVRKEGEALVFFDEEGNEKAKWKAPVLEDSRHRLSLQVATDLVKSEDGYTVTYAQDESFFNEDTVYPVTLASTYDANTQLDVDSGYIRSGSPNQTSNYNDLFVGYDTGGLASGLQDPSIIANARTFIDFSMPDIGSNQLITSANLILTKKSDYSGWEIPSIEVYDTNGKVNPNTVTWNSQPSNVTYVSSLSELNGFGSKYFDITSIIDAMYKGKSTSIMLKSSAESNDNYIPSVFYSESVGTGDRPRIQIAHRDDYDVSPDIGINDFQAKFRFYTSGYNGFQGFSMDGIAKPFGNVNVQLYQKLETGMTALDGKLSSVSTGAYFTDPIFISNPLSDVQAYPDEDVNYTTDYFTRTYFPASDAMYTFKIWPSKDSESGTQYETDSFIFYKVKLGDNLKTIAAHYDTTVERIKADNNTTEDIVKQGDEILIRYPKEMPTLSKEVYTPPIRIDTYEAKFKYRGPACYGHCFEGDPINTSTGNFYHETVDFTLQDYETLDFKRTYNSIGENTSIFGDGFNTLFEQYIAYDSGNNIVFFAGDGKILRFPYQGGTYGNLEEHTINVQNHLVTIKNTTTQETMAFDLYGMLNSITDKDGHKIVIQYDNKARITGAKVGEKQLTFEYYPDKRLVKAIHLPNGTSVQYEYNNHKLVRFIDAKGESERYTYDSNGRISSITDRTGHAIANNVYDAEGKVTSQKDGKGQETKLRYAGDTTTVTYSDQTVKTFQHNSDYKVNAITDENGEKTTYTYQNGRMTGKSDASGTITYEYNSAGNLTKQHHPDGTTMEYTYDNNQNLLSKKEASGQTESYTYNGQDPITKTDADGNTTTYVYDQQHRVIKETDVFGVWKSYTYEGNQIKTITHSNGLIITYTYDANGNMIKESDSNGRTTSYQYDANNRIIKKINALNESEEYRYDANGNMIAYVDGNGAVTTYQYDANNNQISSKKGNLSTSKTYDAKNRVVSETNEQGQTTTYVYDGTGKKIKSIDDYGQETVYHYNAQGDLIETIDPKGNTNKEEYDKGHRRISSTDPYGNVTRYTYDQDGQLIETKQPNGKIVSSLYENHKQVETSDEFGNITEMEYDNHGRMIKKSDDRGNVIEMQYNHYGQVTAQIENGLTTTYRYDVYGNVTEITDPYGVTTIKAYDALDRLVSETDALGGTIRHRYDAAGNEIETIDQAGYTTKKEFNMLGQCIREIDENGNETVYAYDDRGLNTAIWKGSRKTEFFYDEHGDMTETRINDVTVKEVMYDAYGREVKEITPEETMTYVYDTFDRRIEEHNETTGLTITKEYDNFSNVVKETDSEGKITAYTYDDHHRLIETTDAYGRTQTKKYDDFSHVIEETSFTNETVRYRYDEHNDLVSTTDARGNETINTYDGRHRLLSSTFHGITTTYTYDALGRTIEVHTSDDDVSVYTEYDAKGNVISQSDKNGNVTTHTYDGKGQELTTTDVRGNTSTKAYDENGNIVKEIDANGNMRQTIYNSFNLKEMEIDERGFATTYVYDEKLRVKEIIGKLNETTAYIYDSQNRIAEMVDPNGNHIRYAYDIYGNTIQEIDGNGNETLTEYDVLNNVTRICEEDKITTHIYDEYGRLTQTNFNDTPILEQVYDEFGNIIEKTENGNDHEMAYDAYGTLIYEEINGIPTEYVYDEHHRLSQKIEHEDKVYEYTYDLNGNELTQTLNGTPIKTSAYDENGNIIQLYEKGIQKQFLYDNKNQIIEEQHLTNGSYRTYMTYVYDETGNVIETQDALGAKETKTYDAYGQVTSQTDANGHTTKYAYDLMGNLTKVQDPKENIITYLYDANGNPIKKAIGEIEAVYTYDQHDRKVAEENEYGYQEAYTYDIFDNIVSYTKPDGTVIEYAYDEKNQQIIEGDRTFAYDERGNRTSASQGDQTITYAYDEDGNIIETTDSSGRTTSYTYDVFGNQTSIIYPDNTKVEYKYNAFNAITKVIENDEIAAVYTYDDLGNPISVERKGIITQTQYDELGRKIDILTTQEDKELSHISYTYDDTGNILSETIDGKTNTYAYDELDELSQTTKYNQDGIAVTTNYGYDFFGNQTERTGDETTIYEYEDQKLVRIKDEEGITNIHYDDNGNMSRIAYGDGTKAIYSYDTYGQLIKLEKDDGTTYTYAYDAEGDRINYKKLNNDPIHQNEWYTGINETGGGDRQERIDRDVSSIEEHSEESFEAFKEKLNKANDYICTFEEDYFHTSWYQGDSEQVIDKTKEHHQVLWQSKEGNQIYGNERLYSEGSDSETIYIYGINDSVYAYLSKEGDKEYLHKQSYDDYGNTDAIGNRFGYDGESQEESGLIYLRARYYDPKIARFIQIDSFQGDMEHIQSQNRYIYTLNNPYKYTDPSGHKTAGGFRKPSHNTKPKDLAQLKAQAERNNTSLVAEAEYERKRDTQVKQGTWRPPISKPGNGKPPVKKLAAAEPCPSWLDGISDWAGNFVRWIDDNINSIVQTAGYIVIGLGAIAMISAGVGMSAVISSASVGGLMLVQFADKLSTITIYASNFVMIGSSLQIGSGITGYKLDGSILSKEEAEQRIRDGSFNLTLGYQAYQLGEMAQGITLKSNVKQKPQSNNDEGASGANKGIGNPVKVEGRGSTGRVIPNNLNEQMAMHEVQSNPLQGASELSITMSDPRWPASEGWVKMQKVITTFDGSKITIHFDYNKITGTFDDFKFK